MMTLRDNGTATILNHAIVIIDSV